MASASVVNVPEILKEIWLDGIENYFYDEQPGLALMSKKTDWDGTITRVTVQVGGMGGRSHDFADAQAGKSPPVYHQMHVEYRRNFQIWSIDHELVTLSRNKRGALVEALAENTEKAVLKLKGSTCHDMWRNGGGAFGKIGAIATNTITLVDKNDIRNVEQGDWVQLSADDGTGGAGPRNSGAALRVTAINEDTGVVTFHAGVVATVAAAAVGDFLFVRGDYNKAFTGVQAYIPIVTPGTTGLGTTVPGSIWNMSRLSNPTKLAGSRFTGTVATCVADISAALAAAHRRKCRITHLFVTPEIYAAIEASIQGQKRYIEEKVGKIGFHALEFTTQGGRTVKVYSDADIPRSPDGTKVLVFGLNMETWKLHTADEYPMWLTQTTGGGAQKFMLHATENASEGRLGGYGNFYPKSPGDNFVLVLST